MPSRTSQRMRRRRNQCSSAILPSTTQRYTPRPEPCPVPRRARYAVIWNRIARGSEGAYVCYDF
ncbi:hypothetical protein [Streptomyces sp. CoH27]|uniref:hypothetical protein n=1 Tax=Streptomyces sp. CoH27 TaxID=2875763 RepID=UPI0035A99BD3